MSEIETTQEGQLTEAQANELRLGVAKVAKAGFTALAKLTDEELLLAFDKPTEAEKFTEAVNEAYQGMLEAKLPQVFNNHIGSMANGVVEKMFGEIAQKSNSNLIKLIERTTGLDYDDMTPKQVVEFLEKE